jgi:hypothetical protein
MHPEAFVKSCRQKQGGLGRLVKVVVQVLPEFERQHAVPVNHFSRVLVLHQKVLLVVNQILQHRDSQRALIVRHC